MHPITFKMKRCHLSAVAFGRAIFRGTRRPDDDKYDGVPDMTPARFDILYLVHGEGNPESSTPGRIGMAELRKLLGLARSTISEAVGRLVELGFVTCEPSDGDARCKVVELTKMGLSRIKRAIELVFEGQVLARHLERYVDPVPNGNVDWKRKLASHIAEELGDIRDELEALAAHLFDRSADLYVVYTEDDD